MALQQLQEALPYPYIFRAINTSKTISSNVSITLDATGEKAAHLGFVTIAGRATSKTLSAAGGGSIRWQAGTSTWANAGTSMTVGLQSISTSVGPRPNPDGTFTVSRVLTGGDGNVTSGATNTLSMTGGSGTVTLSHNDPVAIVWDMTARAGSDSVLVASFGGQSAIQLPHTISHNGTIWTASTSADVAIPMVTLVFDDGTLGMLHFAAVPWTQANEDYADVTNPDERGLIFQVPFSCTVDSAFCGMRNIDASAAATVNLYADPTGTPSLLASSVMQPRWNMGSERAEKWVQFSSQVELSPGTNYCIALQATGTTAISLQAVTLGNAPDRALFSGGSFTMKATRNGGSGAFTAESPAVTLYRMGVGISQLDDGVGGGGGGSYGIMGG